MKINVMQRRELAVEAPNQETRTVTFAASSEYPVARYDWDKNRFYEEILSHNPVDVDLSRINSGAPLLDGHRGDTIGINESAEIRDGRMIVTSRFGKGARASEVWQDVVDGIRRAVSIGYEIIRCVKREVMEDGHERLTFAWRPYEVSFVGVPADPTVGVGRAMEIDERALEVPAPEISQKTIFIVE